MYAALKQARCSTRSRLEINFYADFFGWDGMPPLLALAAEAGDGLVGTYASGEGRLVGR